MRTVRFIFALLIGFSLATAPVAAAVAGPAMSSGMSMKHCNKAAANKVSVASTAKVAAHCDCCDQSNVCRADTCGAQCVKIPGYLATVIKSDLSAAREFPRPSSDGMAVLSWPPPAPPPRV